MACTASLHQGNLTLHITVFYKVYTASLSNAAYKEHVLTPSEGSYCLVDSNGFGLCTMIPAFYCTDNQNALKSTISHMHDSLRNQQPQCCAWSTSSRLQADCLFWLLPGILLPAQNHTTYKMTQDHLDCCWCECQQFNANVLCLSVHTKLVTDEGTNHVRAGSSDHAGESDLSFTDLCPILCKVGDLTESKFTTTRL